jgi:hypothetical protein
MIIFLINKFRFLTRNVFYFDNSYQILLPINLRNISYELIGWIKLNFVEDILKQSSHNISTFQH